MFRKRRFVAVVDAQLDLFATEHRDLVEEAADLLAAYNSAGSDDAEERYGDYLDATAAGRDALEEMRDHYARSLDEPAEYEQAFDRAVARRWPQFAAPRDD